MTCPRAIKRLKSRRLVSFISLVFFTCSLTHVGPANAHPYTEMSCAPPSGGYQNFSLCYSSNGNSSWPNYVFVDLYNSSGVELASYPHEDPTVYYIPGTQTTCPDPTASPTGSEFDDPTNAATVVLSVVGEWGGSCCSACATGYGRCRRKSMTSRSVRAGMPGSTPVLVRYGDKRPAPSQNSASRNFDISLEAITPVWAETTPYVPGVIVTPSSTSGQRFRCVLAGVSGYAPNWSSPPPRPITSVLNPNMQDSGAFVVAGDVTQLLVVGRPIVVAGSTTNDETYTITGFAVGGGNTTINVHEPIPTATAPLGTIDVGLHDGSTHWVSAPPVAELRLVYGLFRKTDPETDNIIPITETAGNVSHIFRRVRHNNSTQYSVPPRPDDNPYTFRDIHVDLSQVSPSDYVYLDVFVVDLTDKSPDVTNSWALPRIQVQP